MIYTDTEEQNEKIKIFIHTFRPDNDNVRFNIGKNTIGVYHITLDISFNLWWPPTDHQYGFFNVYFNDLNYAQRFNYTYKELDTETKRRFNWYLWKLRIEEDAPSLYIPTWGNIRENDKIDKLFDKDIVFNTNLSLHDVNIGFKEFCNLLYKDKKIIGYERWFILLIKTTPKDIFVQYKDNVFFGDGSKGIDKFKNPTFEICNRTKYDIDRWGDYKYTDYTQNNDMWSMRSSIATLFSIFMQYLEERNKNND